MDFILIRPFDDNEIVELLAVQHTSGKSTAAAFEKQWKAAVVKTKKNSPTTIWDINKVFQIMENKGWNIIPVTINTVTY